MDPDNRSTFAIVTAVFNVGSARDEQTYEVKDSSELEDRLRSLQANVNVMEIVVYQPVKTLKRVSRWEEV